MWLDRRIQDLFSIELLILQAPMAGSVGSDLADGVAEPYLHAAAPTVRVMALLSPSGRLPREGSGT
jgi:hypothetical protein